MIRLIPWVERQWVFALPLGAFPAVLERLRGTPARAATLVTGATEATLSARPNATWSVKQHLGHLNDLHTLDVGRARAFLARADVLTAADMSNRKTNEGGHDATPIDALLSTFENDRQELIGMLESLGEADIAAAALHPRLGVRIRLIDWAQFVAEHDDHHLAAARAAMRLATGAPA